MNSFLQTTSIFLAIFSAIMTIPVMIRLRGPMSTPAWWGLKLFAGALAPFFVIAGALAAILGITSGSTWACIPGGYAILFFSIYLYRVSTAIKFSAWCGKDFAPDWQSNFPISQKANFLLHPIAWGLPTIAESEIKL
ncbi:MAG TPA: hypothetical protein VFN95_09230, partial [Flavitalea sp.]|nr:hypothetical protein [Flavitalea sp.]